MHKLLQRQLKSYLGGDALETIPEAWKPLLASVNEAYEQVDADRLLLERSLELTSQELIQRNKELRRDIADRKRAEALLAGQTRVLEMIASGASLQEVLDGLCRVVEEQSSQMRCSVLLFGHDGRCLRDGAGPVSDHDVRGLDEIDIGPITGLWGAATSSEHPVMVADIASDPRWAGSREVAGRLGLRTCWSTPIFSKDGKVLGTVAMYARESRQPSLQDAQLMEIAAHLAGIAIERRHVEETLRQQAEELARSNADLEQFAYVASHDLQEPLRMVGIYTQLFARRYTDHLDADADECIGYVIEGVHRMQVLIEGLLAYSRVGTRGQAFEPTDCQAAVTQALANLQAAIQDTHGVVTYDPLPTVMSDVVQLTQVFQNLIGNAIKFHRKHEAPRVHLSAVRKGAEWVFAVRDNGIGLDPKYTDRIFVIFQRLHTRAEYPGTGIGLAICKKIVERHGGRMWLDSQPGTGTTFYFTIPASLPAPPSARSRAEQAGQQQGGAA